MKKLTVTEQTIAAILICFTLFGISSQLIEANTNTSSAGSEASQAASNIDAIIEELK